MEEKYVKTYCSRKCLLLLVLLLALAAPAFADPVELNVEVDDPLHFNLVPKGGPINDTIQLTLKPFVITPNGLWQYS